jgi:hypothetical protein
MCACVCMSCVHAPMCGWAHTHPHRADEHSALPSTFASSAHRRSSTVTMRKFSTRTSANGTPHQCQTWPRYAPLPTARATRRMRSVGVRCGTAGDKPMMLRARVCVCVWARACPHLAYGHSPLIRLTRRRLTGVHVFAVLQLGHQQMEHRITVKHVPGMRHLGRLAQQTRSVDIANYTHVCIYMYIHLHTHTHTHTHVGPFISPHVCVRVHVMRTRTHVWLGAHASAPR